MHSLPPMSISQKVLLLICFKFDKANLGREITVHYFYNVICNRMANSEV